MKKIEIIWRELLYQALERKNRRFTQKELAAKFGFSTSTIFQALKVPRKMGAVRVTGRYFVLEDPEKLLYHWASFRNFEKDIILRLKTNLSVFEIEGRMPPEVIFGAFSAARRIIKDVPADYDKVYVYVKNLKTQISNLKTKSEKTEVLKRFQERFDLTKGTPNLFVLEADPFLGNYGQITSLAQTFVDLWNMPEWYAKEYINALRKKINTNL